MVANKYKKKVEVKLNKPNLSQTSHYQSVTSNTQRKIKPRYQICVPVLSLEDSFDNDSREE